MIKLLTSKKGFGIVGAISVLAIGSMAFIAISNRTSTLMKASSYDENIQTLVAIKRTIRDSIDCIETLNIHWDWKSESHEKPGQPTCKENMPIKNIAGDVLNFDDFDIRAECSRDCSKCPYVGLKFKIVSGPPVQINKNRKWSQTKIGNDLMKETRLCRAFFNDDKVPFTMEVGGFFMTNYHWEGHKKYGRIPNPVNGDYKCPKGFKKKRIYGFDNNGCTTKPIPAYYGDNLENPAESKAPYCGVHQYICYRWK